MTYLSGQENSLWLETSIRGISSPHCLVQGTIFWGHSASCLALQQVEYTTGQGLLGQDTDKNKQSSPHSLIRQ